MIHEKGFIALLFIFIMLKSIFATKIGMTQAWDNNGKRIAITKCMVQPNVVLGVQDPKSEEKTYLVGYGKKKLKNMNKPLRTITEKSGFSFGVKNIKGVQAADDNTTEIKAGEIIAIDQVLKVGDVVKVQGTTKGRGFAGGMKRHGFHGGPKTHGQSDRARAVGSIGSGTTPGRVWKGKKMPGHYGVETKSVSGLVVAHIDLELGELWLTGPIPGHIKSDVLITPVGKDRKIELNKTASGIKEVEEVKETESSEKVVTSEQQAE